ncbi:uncharacterized protein LOC101219169 isoform X1 [Cucumis sativus]|uniref:uncharacterized protein LOC101219169 isoform X1 n=2 Tax=Cucumis sativus TaxID=3659 RepID=UPI0005ED0E5B|nr:uncharacterized protein LOC101219169 isoform X1 [Cucumis sativus]KAE8648208.1 hypothetical protein Csa_018413 [Cucumis sativus]
MGAPFQWSSSLHTASINLKFPIFPSSTSNFIFYYCKRSPVIDSATRRCAVYAQNSNSPRPKNSKSVVLGDCQGHELVRVSSNPIRPRNSVILSLVSLFDKRSLWRRIFFASKKVRSIILLNVVTIVYASSIPVVKEVEELVDPATFNVVRFAMTAIPFVPLVLDKWDDVEIRDAGIELGFWVSLGYLMQAFGLITSDAGRASFISMLTVLVVPLLDGLLGAIVPARTWFGALMSVVGVAMLESSGSPPCVGDLLNFMSAIFFGVHMLRTEHISRRIDKDKFLPLLAYEVCVVSILSILWYFIWRWINGTETISESWNWKTYLDWVFMFPWVPALYTGLLSTGFCLWLEMAAMCDVSATETAIIYSLEPVWGGSFAWILLGERWGLTGWIGAALVLGGSLTVQILASSSTKSCKDETSKNKEFHGLLSSSDEHSLTTSPIVITRVKNIADHLK